MMTFVHRVLLLLSLSLAACSPEATGASEAADFPIATEPFLPPEAVPYPRPLTSIRFAQDEHDAGRVRRGRTLRHRFDFTNTGRAPLYIVSVHGSCSCVVLDKPDEAIAPGQRGSIAVQFSTRHLLGWQQPAIVVAANTVPAQTTLYLSALVEP